MLNALEPPAHRAYLFERLLPFELEVMHARTAYWAGDHMGYLDALVELQTRCKHKSREAGREARALERELEGSGGVGKGGGGKKERRLEKRREASLALVSMWKERGARVSLIMASQLIEMKVSEGLGRGGPSFDSHKPFKSGAKRERERGKEKSHSY